MESSNKFIPQDGDIAVWKNDKGENPKRPDYTGKLTLDGTDYNVKFWTTVPKSGGEVFLSGKVEPRVTEETEAETAKKAAFSL